MQGFEIDPFAAWLSQVALDAVLLETTGSAGWPLPDCVRVCDGLRQPDPQSGSGFDLVIGNPPYGRVGLGPEQRLRFRRSLYGHANLYGIFTDLALRHARSGGIVAYVTPTSFLAGNYFKRLRGLLAVEAPPVSLDFVDARKGVFDDVLQETLLAVYRKDGAYRDASAVTVSLAADGRLTKNPAGTFRLPADASEPWLVPRTRVQVRLLATAAAFPARLRDWGYSVSTGPLVWNRHKPQLREGLVAVGAALERKDLPTTSPRPRYALQAGFSALFAPHLSGQVLHDAIINWQRAHLSKGALARIALRRSGAASSSDGIMVAFPNGETRRLAPGSSSKIARAVIETFAPRFLQLPVVLWLSESGNKVVARDDALASEIGLKIAADRNLPDIILVDLGPAEPLVLFVEVAATDGPVSERRRDALLALTQGAGFESSRVAFLTAYADRDAPAFKKTVSSLAWRTFAWFASEPNNLYSFARARLSWTVW
ncbi:MAG: BsuBI/PstI family type II restriction endonuclease [Chromatiaceae bacterium]